MERPEPDNAARDAAAALFKSFAAAEKELHTEVALAESLSAANAAVRQHGERGRAAAVSALCLKHRQWSLAHVGDTRVWRFRANQLKLLTHDHVGPAGAGESSLWPG
jgi:serine/threonine protein phosphatase PrpC